MCRPACSQHAQIQIDAYDPKAPERDRIYRDGNEDVERSFLQRGYARSPFLKATCKRVIEGDSRKQSEEDY
jgi:hypothetical protein